MHISKGKNYFYPIDLLFWLMVFKKKKKEKKVVPVFITRYISLSFTTLKKNTNYHITVTVYSTRNSIKKERNSWCLFSVNRAKKRKKKGSTGVHNILKKTKAFLGGTTWSNSRYTKTKL